jgi:hypothetical protein
VSKPNPILAVARGHLTVMLPVVVVIVLAGFTGRFLAGTGGLQIGVIVGAVIAWPCWSFLVPRWRDWVEGKGLAPEDVQSLGASTGLLWPRGSFLERTEFRRKSGKAWMVTRHPTSACSGPDQRASHRQLASDAVVARPLKRGVRCFRQPRNTCMKRTLLKLVAVFEIVSGLAGIYAVVGSSNWDGTCRAGADAMVRGLSTCERVCRRWVMASFKVCRRTFHCDPITSDSTHYYGDLLAEFGGTNEALIQWNLVCW